MGLIKEAESTSQLETNQIIYDRGSQMSCHAYAYWPSPRDGSVELICPINFMKVADLTDMPEHIVIEKNDIDTRIIGYLQDEKIVPIKNYIIETRADSEIALQELLKKIDEMNQNEDIKEQVRSLFLGR